MWGKGLPDIGGLQNRLGRLQNGGGAQVFYGGGWLGADDGKSSRAKDAGRAQPSYAAAADDDVAGGSVHFVPFYYAVLWYKSGELDVGLRQRL